MYLKSDGIDSVSLVNDNVDYGANHKDQICNLLKNKIKNCYLKCNFSLYIFIYFPRGRREYIRAGKPKNVREVVFVATLVLRQRKPKKVGQVNRKKRNTPMKSGFSITGEW